MPRPYPERTSTVDPAPQFADLRDSEPVCPVTMPSGQPGYLVSRYDDARRVLSDDAFSLTRVWRPGAPQFSAGPQADPTGTLAALDPPEHTRVRKLVGRMFGTRRVEGLRPTVREVADRLLDQVVASGAPADLGAAYCAPLPALVDCRLLAIPERDHEDFCRWSAALTPDMAGDQERWRDAWRGMGAYLTRQVEARRETPEDDPLSELVAGFDRVGGVTDFELVILLIQLVAVGEEALREQLGIFVQVLARDPEGYARLREEPALVPGAVEELLRLHPRDDPLYRIAVEDRQVSGTVIPAGSGVVVEPSSANRDRSVFADAESTDFERDARTHLTFGYGSRFCPGAPLARVELQVAVDALVRRFPRLTVSGETSGLLVTW